ncbi:MAG: hydroxyacid dehydrogenase [Kiritimatiellae bacterium]|nr:hydroxyacid dehydrogenase [Kiritimatiellia bacterium]
MISFLVSRNPSLGAYAPSTIDALRAEAGLVSATAIGRDEVLSGAASDAEVVFSSWGMPEFSSEEIAAHLPRLRAVFYAAGTVQAFARPFLERGIRVCSAWRENAVPVAEFAVSQILLANKGFFQTCRRCRSLEARAESYRIFSAFPGNFDSRVGLLGCGSIGRLVAEALRKHRLEVLVFDPFLPDSAAEALGVRKASLEEIFSTCQTVSNHLANNAQTRGMLGYSLFSRMLPNATFVNTGRGAQVVEADLVRALEEAPGRSALLDVTWPEPPPAGHPFYGLPNVFLTPHMAGSSGLEIRRMGEAMLEEFRAWRADPETPTPRCVTIPMLATMA